LKKVSYQKNRHGRKYDVRPFIDNKRKVKMDLMDKELNHH